ncbi:hypothetical protein B9Z55_006890 [Caenorhabditis nigoni]|uniref:7TM GPCR serpentine receptor class x (Srx) domain-containing protein n=1 Tax=Caenorhabditis nigoni TaxID=1611254 RepID=A0A2G5V774_9PELO|nr:hypothetical protein B9Z55_006890 [Caenorhabditis nigoni]
MIFSVNNGEYTIWIPIYTLDDDSYDTYFYRGLLIIELILSIFAFLFIVTSGYIIITTRAFHTNMNSLYAYFVISWMFSGVGNSLTTPYIIGTWKVDDNSTNYRSWWTDDVAEMTPIKSIQEAWPLFLGGFLTWYYMFLTVRVFVCGFVMIMCALILVIVITFKCVSSWDTFLTYCFNNIVHLNPLIICPVLIFSVSTWSKALLHSRLPIIDKITKITFIDLPAALPAQNIQQETETYFSQLKNVWEK